MSLDAGEYTLEADAPHLGYGHLEGIVVTGGVEARLQAAMNFEPGPPVLLDAAAPIKTVHPSAAPAFTPLAASVPHGTVTPTVPVSAPRQPESATRTPALPERASLETQTAAMQLSVIGASPHNFPLAASALPSVSPQAALLIPPLPVASAATQNSDPVTPAVATTVTAAQLQVLPASGRRWQEFLLDTPAANTTTESSQASFRGSQEPAEIAIDDANTRLAFGVAAGSVSGSQASEQGEVEQSPASQSASQGWAGGRGLGVSEAAIREVTSAAGNVEAESMRSAGGRTTIRTESGANALHGQGFLFDRQNTWGAQNPYTQWLQNTGTAATPGSTPIIPFEPVFSPISYTPPDHETVWGLGIGSRIRRDKLFWFAALDSYHRNDPGLAMAKYPIGTYTDSTTGDQYCVGFFCPPSNAQFQLLGAQLGESTSEAASDYFGMSGPASTAAGLEQLASLLAPAPRHAAQWTGFGRIDWQAAERHHFTFEGTGTDWNAPGGGLTRVSENYGSHSFGSSQASQQWLLARWEAYLTPNLLAVTQGSAGRTVLSAKPDTPSSFEQKFLSASSSGQLPQIVVDSGNGFTIGNPSRFGQGSYPDERLYHAQEMLDWVHDKLLVKAGFELDHNTDTTSLLRNQTGTYHYSKVQNFISDALAFLRFGLADALDPGNPHNCDATGGPWYDSNGQLMGLGAMPCYSSYSQMIGPSNWRLSTNDWAGYATAQWQPDKVAVFAAGLRWEREQLPPPIAALDNPQLPFTEKLPELGNNWGPRLSLAIGAANSHWPVLRLGYGMYYGRVQNATIETALTQTGSLKGDLYFFMRPQDDCQGCSGGAPPFPYVLSGQPSSVVKPGVVGFAPNFRNPEIHQAVAAIERPLPGRIQLTAAAMLSLGRRLPVSIDTNLDFPATTATITYDVCDQTPATPPGASNPNAQCGHLGLGPIKAAQVTVPFYASWPAGAGACPYPDTTTGEVLPGRPCPDYQAITQITSKANSTYEAAMIKLTRYGSRGLSLHAHYTYAHAMDWNPDGITLAPGSDVMDPNPADFSKEYGTSDQDVRHSAVLMAIFEAPWKLRDFAGRIANGWALSGVGQFHSGLPYSMHVTGSIPECSVTAGACTPPSGISQQISGIVTGLGSSMNGYGGDDRYFGLPRNTFRYPSTWKADLRLGKRFDLGEMRQLEILAETFNLFNHQNVTEIETTGYTVENGSSTTLPSLNFLTGLYVNPKTGLASPAFGKPLNINATDFYRERQIQLGLRMRF